MDAQATIPPLPHPHVWHLGIVVSRMVTLRSASCTVSCCSPVLTEWASCCGQPSWTRQSLAIASVYRLLLPSRLAPFSLSPPLRGIAWSVTFRYMLHIAAFRPVGQELMQLQSCTGLDGVMSMHTAQCPSSPCSTSLKNKPSPCVCVCLFRFSHNDGLIAIVFSILYCPPPACISTFT